MSSDRRPSDAPNVVLTGFMGTGKTTVGRLVADRLGLDFVDTDELIEERHGPIPTIFAERGEAAFRELEAAIALELGSRRDLVIATGGRMLLDESNAAALSSTARVFCLTAPASEIATRVASDHDGRDRPLLAGGDPAARIADLLEERSEGYARFLQIDTHERSPAEVADAIVAEITMTDASTDWWRHAVVYQVYIRSFADGNGDGTGDIAGLRSRLDYLADLGIDAIWINPWYSSPLHDGGYDVADYREIDSRFGTTEEAELLLTEAHDRGIRVIVDLVPNHTSNEHEWFRAALAAASGSPERARYLFRPGQGTGGAEPPNNWTAVFGGAAWEQVSDGEWYLHLFDVSQPDLDWENPEVRDEFLEIFRFWLDRGVDGFRVDVAHGLVKDPELPDLEIEPELLGGAKTENHPYWDRDGVHEIIREWRAVLDEYDDRMMVAEAWVRPERLPLYLRSDEYHQSFNFALVEAEWGAENFREIIEESVRAALAVGATTTWVLSNHDVMRHASRYGLAPGVPWRHRGPKAPVDPDPELGQRRARAAALITLSLPGSVYVYQGEELGLPEVLDLPEAALDDPVWTRSGRTEYGRDGCRVPIPWTTAGPSFGFGDAEPWMPQPDDFGARSVEAQRGDPESMLELYRAGIGLREGTFGSSDDVVMVELGPDVLSYRRDNGASCVVNMGDEPIELPPGRVVLRSGALTGGTLPPDTAVWIVAED